MVIREPGERTASDSNGVDAVENGGSGKDAAETVNVNKRVNRLCVYIVAGKGVSGGREGEGEGEEGQASPQRWQVHIPPSRDCDGSSSSVQHGSLFVSQSWGTERAPSQEVLDEMLDK